MKLPAVVIIIALLINCAGVFAQLPENKSASKPGTKILPTLDKDFKKNKVIAHRGAWKNTKTPENSLASLEAAINMGCMGSEVDVHMSSDSAIIINHDPHYAGLPVQQSTLNALKNIPLANGESIPVLEDFLRIIQQQKGTRLILEIKPSQIGHDWAMATVKKVMDIVQKMKAQPWIIYISFDYEMCKEILRIDPNASVQYLNGDKTPAELRKDGMTGMNYHYSVYNKHPEWIQQAKDEGLKLNAWTVNDPQIMKLLLQYGFDYITTNEPEMLFDLLKN